MTILPLVLLAVAAHAAPLKSAVPELPATVVAAGAAGPAAAVVAPTDAAAPAAVPAAIKAELQVNTAKPMPVAASQDALSAGVLKQSRAMAELMRQADVAQAQAGQRKYMCQICGYVYDEAKGDPANGIAPGTKWEDVPADWVCPECGETKEQFAEDMVEVR